MLIFLIYDRILLGDDMEKVILTNMCMIYDEVNKKVLIQERKKSWPGNAFPGGHINPGEAIVTSVIREIKEETGLDIFNPKLVAVRDWCKEDTRTVSFLFVCTTFSGSLISETEEGKVFWKQIEDLKKMNFAQGFKDQLQVFLKRNYTEIYSCIQNGKEIYKYF